MKPTFCQCSPARTCSFPLSFIASVVSSSYCSFKSPDTLRPFSRFSSIDRGISRHASLSLSSRVVLEAAGVVLLVVVVVGAVLAAATVVLLVVVGTAAAFILVVAVVSVGIVDRPNRSLRL